MIVGCLKIVLRKIDEIAVVVKYERPLVLSLQIGSNHDFNSRWIRDAVLATDQLSWALSRKSLNET